MTQLSNNWKHTEPLIYPTPTQCCWQIEHGRWWKLFVCRFTGILALSWLPFACKEEEEEEKLHFSNKRKPKKELYFRFRFLCCKIYYIKESKRQTLCVLNPLLRTFPLNRMLRKASILYNSDAIHVPYTFWPNPMIFLSLLSSSTSTYVMHPIN